MNEYDLSNMKRVPHPLQYKIDSGELRLQSPFDISEEDFQEKLELLDEEDREFALECKQLWAKRQRSGNLPEGKITIRDLQKYIKQKEYNPEKKYNYILKFMEETGGLARAILNDYPHAESGEIKDTIEEEFCDVLFYLLAIANLYDVDIEKWIPIKEQETDKLYNTNYYEKFFVSK